MNYENPAVLLHMIKSLEARIEALEKELRLTKDRQANAEMSAALNADYWNRYR